MFESLTLEPQTLADGHWQSSWASPKAVETANASFQLQTISPSYSRNRKPKFTPAPNLKSQARRNPEMPIPKTKLGEAALREAVEAASAGEVAEALGVLYSTSSHRKHSL